MTKDVAPDPYGYSKLTEEALLDEANGLRGNLDDAKVEIRTLKSENMSLKALSRDMNASEPQEVIRRQAAQIKHLLSQVAKASQSEASAIAARRHMARERDEALDKLGAQEIEI